MEDSMTKAKRLMSKMKLGKLNKAVVAWKELYELEQSIQNVETVVQPLAESFDKKPSDRTPKDVARLVPIISKIKAFQGLATPVHEFLATYVNLDVVWDSVEMPRSTSDNNSLFCIISGSMRGIVAEAGDPQLIAMARMAARQLVNTTQEEKQMTADESKADDPAAGAAAAAAGGEAGAAPAPEAAAAPRRESDTLTRFGLGPQYNIKQVTTQLWRTMMEIMHQGLMPSRTAAIEILATGVPPKKPAPPMRTSHAGSGAVVSGALATMAARVSMTGGAPAPAPAAPPPPRRVSVSGNRASMSGAAPAAPAGRVSMPGGGPPGAAAGTVAAAAEAAKAAPPKAAVQAYGGVGPALVELHAWESFSGRDMECRADVGHIEDQVAEVPARAQGAACTINTVTALVVVSRGVYRRAMQMQQEISVRNAVDSCCRLPFLRHTPLKELYKLSKHLNSVTFNKGDVLIAQGKEHTSVFFLLSGEVELAVDVPLTSDREALLTSLLHIIGKERPPTSRSASVGRNGGAANRMQSETSHGDVLEAEAEDQFAATPLSTTRRSRSTSANPDKARTLRGPMQRVVLGRRGPGTILGDDSIREKHMLVSVIATGPVLALSTSAQRFTASLDGLTQRLFNKLRVQAGATSELGRAITDASLRAALSDRCRGEVIAQTFEGRVASGMPNTLRRGEGGAAPKPWRRADPGGMFSSVASLEAGEQAAIQAARAGRSRHGGGELAHPNSELLTAGLRMTMFKDATVSESLSTFLQEVRTVEERRVDELLKLQQQNEQVSSDLLNCSSCVVSKLDLSDVFQGSTSVHQQYTDMLEAACLAIIKVGPVQGQSAVASEVLSPVLDDAIVSWSQLTHSHGLQLVRWTSHEYYLIGGLNPGGQKRPMVRIMADALLEMKDVFYFNLGQSDVPYFYYTASMVIGTVFSSYDCGRFLSGVTGHAFNAAAQLCTQVQETHPCGAILVSDAVMQAIGRTHSLEFNGGGYLLSGRALLPFGATFEDILGKGTLEREPLSKGNPKASLFRIVSERQQQQQQQQLLQQQQQQHQSPRQRQVSTSHFGDAGAAYTLDDGYMTVQAPNTSRVSNLAHTVRINLSDDSGSGFPAGPLSPSSGPHSPVGGRAGKHASNNSRHHLAPLTARLPLNPSSAASHPEPSSPPPVASASSVVAQQQGAQQHTRITPPLTLEPHMDLMRVSKLREKSTHKSCMDLRKQLRQELQDLRSSVPGLNQTAHVAGSTLPLKNTARSGVVKNRPAQAASHTSSSYPASSPPANLHKPLGEVVAPPAVHGMTPYHPGAGPLGSLSARRRRADILFASSEAGAEAAAAEAAGLARPEAASGRPRSPGPAGAAGAAAAGPFAFVASPSLRPLASAAEPDRPTSSGAGAPFDAATASTSGGAFLTTVSSLQTPPGSRRGSRPASQGHQRPGSGLGALGGATRDLNTVDTNFGPVALPPLALEGLAAALQQQQGASEGGRGGSPAGGREQQHQQLLLGRPGSRERSPLRGMPALTPLATEAPQFVLDVKATTRSRQVDPVSGLTATAIHEQAVTTWKDLGSVRAAEEYVQHLNPALINISFSTAGLTSLPDMSRLPYLDSVAASFNIFGSLAHKSKLLTLAPHVKVLSLSHSHITQLPPNIGEALPHLLELNVSCNELTELPDSLFTGCTNLTALSIERNQVSFLPSTLSQLQRLRMLYASNNEIEDLSDDAFASMPNLQVLDLSFNALKELPPSTTALCSLHTLVASCNLLEDLPYRFLATATALTRLELAENSLFRSGQVTGLSPTELELYNAKYNAGAEDDFFDPEEYDATPRAMQGNGLAAGPLPSRLLSMGDALGTGPLGSGAMGPSVGVAGSTAGGALTARTGTMNRSMSMKRMLSLRNSRTSVGPLGAAAGAGAGAAAGEAEAAPPPAPALAPSRSEALADQEVVRTTLAVDEEEGTTSGAPAPGPESEGGVEQAEQQQQQRARSAGPEPSPSPSSRQVCLSPHPTAVHAVPRNSAPGDATSQPDGNGGGGGGSRVGTPPLPSAREQRVMSPAGPVQQQQGLAVGGEAAAAAAARASGKEGTPRAGREGLRSANPRTRARSARRASAMRDRQQQYQQGSAAEDDSSPFKASPFACAAVPDFSVAEVSGRTPCEAGMLAAERPNAQLLPRLQSLDLSSNRLLAIPPWLSPSLTSVNLSRNQLVSVPSWIAGRLASLRLLSLHGNKITSVSRELTRLNKLQMVALQENPCTELVEAQDAPAAGAGGRGGTGGGASVAWIDQHLAKMKYQVKVENLNNAAAAASEAAAVAQAAALAAPPPDKSSP